MPLAYQKTLTESALILRFERSAAEILTSLRDLPEARATLSILLAEAPWPAFYWECTPIWPGQTQAWEMRLLPAPSLGLDPPDPSAFQTQFRGRAAPEVAVFESLGKDAMLIAPCPPQASFAAYGHLASFLRRAAPRQIDQLWATFAWTATRRLASRPGTFWTSTSGLGVPWLHLRIDEQPKYFHTAAYRNAST